MNSKDTILFAGGSSGTGHIHAAENIADAIKASDDQIETEIVNVFDCLPIDLRFILDDLWRICSLYFKPIYRVAHKRIIANPSLPLIIRRRFDEAAKRMLPFLKEKQIKAYVATHPAAAVIGSILKNEFGYYFAVVPTDFLLHNFHFYPNVDFYYLPPIYSIVGSYGSQEKLLGKALDTGIPVALDFCESQDKTAQRCALKLSAKELTIFMSFGGRGFGAERHLGTIRDLLESNSELQLIIAAGHNVNFKRKVTRLISDQNANNRVRVFGFTNNISDMMAASDIFIGKAGGLAISEALATNLPIGILDALPGQEDYNAKFVLGMKLGVKINSADELIAWINQPQKKKTLNAISRRMAKYNRCDSSYRIASHILYAISGSSIHSRDKVALHHGQSQLNTSKHLYAASEVDILRFAEKEPNVNAPIISQAV